MKAQNALGRCYENGIGVEKNRVKAAEWYWKAAEQGNVEGQLNFGIYYETIDLQKAAEYYWKAADQGNATAQYLFGGCCLNGRGMEKNEKAAEQGNAEAQFALGECLTGSTGSGKSNTVYTILNAARNNGVKFLVVEPAKGEYKSVFGTEQDVHVYGTNPMVTPLLRINPFSFPKGVHVFEHLDRLVEIFNVCWPMYAAMPAVLKNAIEKSYADCGWDLVESTNP